MDAEGRYGDHAPLLPTVAILWPRYDDAHLHGAGQSGFFPTRRHGGASFALAGPATIATAMFVRFALHRGQAERLPELSLAYLDRQPIAIAPACSIRFRRWFPYERYVDYLLEACQCISAIATASITISPGNRFSKFMRR